MKEKPRWRSNIEAIEPAQKARARLEVRGRRVVELSEQIQVWSKLAHDAQILHHPTWGVMEDAAILTPSKVAQFALGWHSNKSITKSSYYVEAKFSGENSNAMELMEVAQKAWAMH